MLNSQLNSFTKEVTHPRFAGQKLTSNGMKSSQVPID